MHYSMHRYHCKNVLIRFGILILPYKFSKLTQIIIVSLKAMSLEPQAREERASESIICSIM